VPSRELRLAQLLIGEEIDAETVSSPAAVVRVPCASPDAEATPGTAAIV